MMSEAQIAYVFQALVEGEFPRAQKWFPNEIFAYFLLKFSSINKLVQIRK